jgi:hypothetical protein
MAQTKNGAPAPSKDSQIQAAQLLGQNAPPPAGTVQRAPSPHEAGILDLLGVDIANDGTAALMPAEWTAVGRAADALDKAARLLAAD